MSTCSSWNFTGPLAPASRRSLAWRPALVTSGAAASLLLGTAACVTKGDPDRIHRLPDTAGMPHEVIVQPAHLHGFEHAIRAAGGRFVPVETLEGLERAIGPQTAMLYFLAYGEAKGRIGMAEWIAVGRRRGIPNFLDAAAELPPSGNLRRYCDAGFDLVAFSGGKGLARPAAFGAAARAEGSRGGAVSQRRATRRLRRPGLQGRQGGDHRTADGDRFVHKA